VTPRSVRLPRATLQHQAGKGHIGAAQVAEHERLNALWKEHCLASIDQDEAWEAMGLNPGALWLGDGVFFELAGAVYLNLGIRLEDGIEQIEGAAEILGSEFETARQRVLVQRNAALLR